MRTLIGLDDWILLEKVLWAMRDDSTCVRLLFFFPFRRGRRISKVKRFFVKNLKNKKTRSSFATDVKKSFTRNCNNTQKSLFFFASGTGDPSKTFDNKTTIIAWFYARSPESQRVYCFPIFSELCKHKHTYIYLYIFAYIYLCIRVWVCARIDSCRHPYPSTFSPSTCPCLKPSFYVVDINGYDVSPFYYTCVYRRQN